MKHATLWKRILNEGLTTLNDNVPRGEDPKKYMDDVITRVLKCPIIVDPTVQAGGEYDFDWSLYKMMSIPFDNTWIEGRFELDTWGCKLTAIKDDDGKLCGRYGLSSGGWMLQAMMFTGQPNMQPFTAGKILLFVDKNGTLLNAESGELVFVNLFSPMAASLLRKSHPGLEEDPVASVCKTSAQMVCDVLRLCGCANVSKSERSIGLSNRESRHAARRTGREGDFKYHVLVVRPPGTKPGGHSKDIEIGTMPRHVCRGHFAEYGHEFKHSDGTPKGLLFGQYAGRFFMPPCVKGRKENGIVEKDYEVRA